jgi:hypothetical protein
MQANTQKVKFTHPFNDSCLEIELPCDVCFADVTRMLYEKGFLSRIKGDYQYIIDGRLCGLNDRLQSHIPPRKPECLEICIHGLLTVLI